MISVDKPKRDDRRHVADLIAGGPNHCRFHPKHLFDDPATAIEGEPWPIHEPKIVFLHRHGLLYEGELERYRESADAERVFGSLPPHLRPPEPPGWFLRWQRA